MRARCRVAWLGAALTALLIVPAALLVGVSGAGQTPDKKILMGFDSYGDTEAINAVAKLILEERLGYRVDVQMYDQGVIYASLARGSLDVASIGYLPNLHKHHWQKFGRDLLKIAPVHEGVVVGLAIPDYVQEVRSISDLPRFRERFEGKVYGASPEAGVTRLAEETIKAYDLPFELVISSEAAEMAMVERKIGRREWIVFAGYAPHWMWAKWKLRRLEDPKKVWGEPEGVYHLARAGFDRDFPDAYAFYKRFQMTPEQQAYVMLLLRDGVKAEAAAKRLLDENPDLLRRLVP